MQIKNAVEEAFKVTVTGVISSLFTAKKRESVEG